MRNWRDDDVTEKQRVAITLIEMNTGYRFNGSTKGAASDFIGANIQESQRNAAQYAVTACSMMACAFDKMPYGLEYDDEFGYYY